MFKNPFSFEGRIRRTEYGISFIIFAVASSFASLIAVGVNGVDNPNMDGAVALNFMLRIPLFWFLWAQGAKRAHDVGHSGWWQIVPFYPFYLLFGNGDKGENKYGSDPKAHITDRQNF